MYVPPVRLFEMPMEISRSINKQNDEYILQAIKKVGVDVDREELIKAMNYDRNQYKKGYSDAIEEFQEWLKTQIVGIDNNTKEILVVKGDRWELAIDAYKEWNNE